jgi:hypothetical protein
MDYLGETKRGLQKPPRSGLVLLIERSSCLVCYVLCMFSLTLPAKSGCEYMVRIAYVISALIPRQSPNDSREPLPPVL